MFRRLLSTNTLISKPSRFFGLSNKSSQTSFSGQKSKLNGIFRSASLVNSGPKRWMNIAIPGMEIKDVPRMQASADEVEKIMLNSSPNFIRNIAIIAHVDHGKTTLVDCLLKESGILTSNERAMDSNAIEQERGITILSKCTSITHNGYKINIVDTPGHADFGGEVERIMSMVDGVCLVVCSTEGPMAQTKFVLQKALKQGLKPIVVINKVDRDTSRVQEVENEIFDLFCSLDANDEQLEYPVIYASARSGWAVKDKDAKKANVKDLLDEITQYIPQPKIKEIGDNPENLSMLITQTESNPYFGRMLIGRIHSGSISVGDKVHAVDATGKSVEGTKIVKIVKRYGMNHLELEKAYAGDIVSLAGFTNATVSNTVNSLGQFSVIPSNPIDPPMISIMITTNDSPLHGKDGDKTTINHIRDRLIKESEDDVSLRLVLDPKNKESIQLFGRGDLHLGILIERMRREGFEMAVSPPQVVYKKDGKKVMEPIEEVTVEIDPEYSATLIEKMTNRKGVLLNTVDTKAGKQKMSFNVPSRGLIGFRAELVADTRGTAIMTSIFLDYDDHRGSVKKTTKGAIISSADGIASAYALKDLELKGILFISPGMPVYVGQVIGEHILDDDIDLNPAKTKRLTNIRTHGHEEHIRLQSPRLFTLEEAVTYAREDELIEVTPKFIRIRKRALDPNVRKKNKRNQKKEEFL